VLWSGKVVADTNKKIDADTQAILDYNRMIQEDTRVENILLPVRDGLLIARKL
jgi:predicted O-methyltransferase YrrM